MEKVIKRLEKEIRGLEKRLKPLTFGDWQQILYLARLGDLREELEYLYDHYEEC